VAYRLALPDSSRIHPVFHVSQLKKFLAPTHQVLTELPHADAYLQVPFKVLNRRVVQKGPDSIPQALVQWSDSTPDQATWEDLESLKQAFPRAPAWGQADFQDRGIVSDTSTTEASATTTEEKTGKTEDSTLPGPAHGKQRVRRLPARLADPVWVR
jgi:hypothetical protein